MGWRNPTNGTRPLRPLGRERSGLGRRAIPGCSGSGPGGDASARRAASPARPAPREPERSGWRPPLHPRGPERSPRPALPRRLARTMPFFCSTNVDPFTRLDTTATPRPSDTATGLGLRAPSPAAAAAAAAVPIPPRRPPRLRLRASGSGGGAGEAGGLGVQGGEAWGPAGAGRGAWVPSSGSEGEEEGSGCGGL